MTKKIRWGAVSAAMVGVLGTGVVMPQTARAQTTDATVSTGKSVPAIDAKNLGLGLVARRLSLASGLDVVTDSSLALTPVTFATFGGPLEMVLTKLSVALPLGTTLRAVLVPDAGSTPDGDTVAALLRAQDAFAPKTPATTGKATDAAAPFTAGQFELMGQRVTLAQAAPQIAALHLRPVYVLMRQRPALDAVAKMGTMSAELMKQWASMTDDQRKQSMELQFHSMMNMEPADRQAMLGQMMQQGVYMMQQMQQMPPDQQKQFMQEAMQEAQKSGLVPPGAGAGGFGGKRPPSP